MPVQNVLLFLLCQTVLQYVMKRLLDQIKATLQASRHAFGK